MPGSRRWVFALTAVAAALGLGAGLVRPRLERSARARIEAEAARRGLVARIGTVRVGLWPPLRLTAVRLERAGKWWLAADGVEAWWAGGTRLGVGQAVLHGPAGFTVEAQPTTWNVQGAAGDAPRVELLRPAAGLVVSRARTLEGDCVTLTATELPMGQLLAVSRSGRPFFDGGTLRGSLKLTTSARAVRFEADALARAARLPALAGDGLGVETLGEPTDLALSVAGSWSRAEDSLEVRRWRATMDGATLSGSLALSGLDTDPSPDLSLEVERVDFARLLRTSGLGAPQKLDPAAGVFGGSDELGSASLSARARGRLSDPASFVVTQRLDFTPPRRMPPAIEKLKGSFVHEVALPSGATQAIDVTPSSPDFIPLADVPPLFLRTLLLGEDAGFYGHPGIDLREVPSALLADWARGGAARGASTITQQLAKNLFLSGDKRLGRKLQELSLALLLESALGKDRILEIYLNVIEWGPGLYGLRPAARTYFVKEPQQLTPAQMAFLVSLIPGPVKYQSSFARGTLVPGFRQLVDALITKLRAADALSEEEYQQALAQEIVVEGRAP